jgi:hypothetical protein
MLERRTARVVRAVRPGSPQASLGAVALVVALALVASACGGSQGAKAGSTATTPAQNATGYLSKRFDGVIFMTWQTDGSSASGVVFESLEQLGNANPTKLETSTASFHASIDDTAVEVEIDKPLSATWKGASRGRTLTLHYTDGDGTTHDLRFVRAGAAQYRAAILAFHCGCTD